MKVVIVGGVAGGATAAARIRRLDESAQIVVFERSAYVSYANCGLPYYIGGVITAPEELTLQTPESFFERFRIEIHVRHEVTDIHPERKTVSVRNLVTGDVFEEEYDKLLLSPGARPVPPSLPGADLERLFTLRTVEDTLRIRRFIEENKPSSAVLAGGGFIGLELAENLRELGLDVTIIQRPRQLMNPFDPDMAAFLHAKMKKKGIHLLLGHSVEGFQEKDGCIETLLADAPSVSSDMVIFAVGVTPDTSLAQKAGLQLGLKGSILVNDKMETSVPDIYAVGDAVQIRHLVTGEDALISLAGPANKQGRIAADNICGISSRFKGSLGSSVIKVFDMTAAVTGINEKTARKLGLDFDKVYLSPANHAGYYPGDRLMTMKVLFEKKSLRLLGAQIIGYEGVDKRIDVLATAIQAGLDASSLTELDLAYAPPYSSAKDPVNMAGFLIENVSKGLLKQYFWDEIDALPRDGSLDLAYAPPYSSAKDPVNMAGFLIENVSKGLLKQYFWDEIDALPRDGSVTLLDTRTAEEYNRGHVDGFRNIPLDELREHLADLPAQKPVYVICQSGLRSYLACRILTQNGFDCYNFSGGYRLYETVRRDKCAAAEAFPCGMDKPDSAQ